ncbi:hypothetical protein PCE1_000469 [Barthelona sp. PCE]
MMKSRKSTSSKSRLNRSKAGSSSTSSRRRGSDPDIPSKAPKAEERTSQQDKVNDEVVPSSRSKLKISRSRPDLERPQPVFEVLPSLKDVSPFQRQGLFLKKIKQSTQILDFTAPNVSQKSIEIKRKCLMDLLEYINFNRSVFNETSFLPIFKMVSANIFHPLVQTHVSDGLMYDPNEDEPLLEPSWAHIQFVYEFFLRFILSHDVDPKVAKKYISGKFLISFIHLFQSEDPRERDYLKTILHKLYAKFMTHRSFIRRVINYTFLTFIYENGSHPGVSELLEILGSIIHGFVLPLKPEHLRFLHSYLLPLYSARLLPSYATPLNYCVTLFVDKDVVLGAPVLAQLLRLWPKTDSSKELIFLQITESVFMSIWQKNPQLLDLQLNHPDLHAFVPCPKEVNVSVPIQPAKTLLETYFDRLGQSVQCQHFEVSERALSLIDGDLFDIVKLRSDVLVPVLFRRLYTVTKKHWRQSVLGVTYSVLKKLMNLDSSMFSSVVNSYKSRLDTMVKRKQSTIWKAIHSNSQFNVQGFDLPSYTQRIVIEQDQLADITELVENTKVDLDFASKESNSALFAYSSTNIRRKSILPQDLETMKLLKRHQSLEEKVR